MTSKRLKSVFFQIFDQAQLAPEEVIAFSASEVVRIDNKVLNKVLQSFPEDRMVMEENLRWMHTNTRGSISQMSNDSNDSRDSRRQSNAGGRNSVKAKLRRITDANLGKKSLRIKFSTFSLVYTEKLYLRIDKHIKNFSRCL